MKYLSLEKLRDNLEKAESQHIEEKAPEGFEDEFFTQFMRAMSEPVNTLDDIPSEVLIEMLERGEELFATLALEDRTFGHMFERLNSCTSAITAKKRRIL